MKKILQVDYKMNGDRGVLTIKGRRNNKVFTHVGGDDET